DTFKSSFNPSEGISLIETGYSASLECLPRCFNPSEGISLIETAGSETIDIFSCQGSFPLMPLYYNKITH
ncbi:MAG: hypothetical protein ACLFTJ_12485, partial [Halothece sp.]